MYIIVCMVFQLVLVYSVACREYCYVHRNHHFEICRTNPTTLSSIRQLQWRFSEPIPTELELTHHEVIELRPLLFIGRTKIKVLKLNLSNDVLNFDPLSFTNLPHLERLEITNGTVLLKEGIFQHLHQLDSLTLAVNESIWSLNYVLTKDLKNLSSLEVLNAERVNICLKVSTQGTMIDTIRQLTYRGGDFHVLEKLAFICIWNLEVLRIIRSNLTIIERRAFGGLEKLRHLELSGNRKLTRIPSYTLNNFEALDTLLLMNNRIQTIEEAALRNQYHRMKTVNISSNDIKRIEEKSFDGFNSTKLDLSANPIQNEKSLARNSFINSQIKELYISSAVYSRRNHVRWGLQKKNTSIYYQLSGSSDYVTEGNSEENSLSTILDSKNECPECHGNFVCCLLDGSHLTYVEAKPGVNETHVIMTLNVTSIGEDAFFNPAVRKLAINLVDGQELTILPYALHLDNLQELEIFNGPVVIQEGMFVKLKSLKFLSIRVQHNTTMVCRILPELEQLENLEIHNHQRLHDICHRTCPKHKQTIKNLLYMNGVISVLKESSFSCLKKLEHLNYYETSIDTIERGAFKGLESLRTLSFFHIGLHKISAAVFMPLVSLEYLQIDKIVMRSFDHHQFQHLLNNTSNYADYTDQLFFGLTHPQLLKFSAVNIYRDDFAEIHIATDEIKWISQDDSRQYSSKSVSKISFLPPSVFPVLQAWDVPSRVVDRDFGDYCRNSSLESTFQICVHAGNTLVSVRRVGTISDRSNVSLVINENGVSSINKGAFSNVNINQLVLNFSNSSRLRATPKSFEGLSGLKSLILRTGPLDLGPKLFQELGSLVELGFSYRTAGGTQLCQVLTDLPELRNLAIYDQDHIDICQASCSQREFSLSQLQYIGGGITVLGSESLKCLKELKRLTITETKLMTIEPNAFIELLHIKSLQLIVNKHLKHIPAGIFDYLVTLRSLDLQMNSIESIGAHTFKFSKHARLHVLDLSHNNISVIERWTFANLTCRKVDLSYNHISAIRSESFQGSNITQLYIVNDRDLVRDYDNWGLQNSTIVFYEGGNSFC